MRIQNAADLVSHGNVSGRQDMLAIMESGLQAADPYNNTKQLLKRVGNLFYIGNLEFEADGDPQSGTEIINLDEIENIYIVGAGKGVQHVALAFEEVLGERLTGGHVISKYGDEVILKRVDVTFGAHPVPDENCVAGCKKILEYAEHVTSNDLVITIIGNGGSSLLTLPCEGIPLEDVKRLTYMMQIEKGASTIELNTIRNHIDQLKGGKIARAFQPAKMIHIIITDANHHVVQDVRHDYEVLMKHNVWLHNLPEGSTFAEAIHFLKAYDCWEDCPESIRNFLFKANPNNETVKYDEFKNMNFRVFGVMPDIAHFLPAARKRAEELGYHVANLTQLLFAESSQAANVVSAIAKNIETYGEPLKPPIALFSTGELFVTVEKHKGVGGRNQEYALAAAVRIAGSKRIIMGSVDSDGTDGPGGLSIPGAPKCLGGGIVDGYTMMEAEKIGVDVKAALKAHATSEALWQLKCGLHVEQNISLNDLTITLVQK